MPTTERPKLTVERRAHLLYQFLLDLQDRYVTNERQAQELESRFLAEIEKQIKNHARDVVNDLHKHFEGRSTFIPRSEVLGLLTRIQKIMGEAVQEDYCLNCDRPLTEHDAHPFGALTLRVCLAHPEREMLIVGQSTAKAIEERTGLLLLEEENNETQNASPEEAS